MMRKPSFIFPATAFLALEIFLIACVDQPLSDYVRHLSPNLIDFFRAYTDFGKSKWYLWPLAVGILTCAVVLRRPRCTSEKRLRILRYAHNLVFMFAGIAVSGLVTDSIKPIVGRARPVELLRDNLYGFHPLTFHAAWNSMPSGHATTAAALAGGLWLLAPRLCPVWAALGIALIASRVMVNAHYLSDVLAGSAVGLSTVAVFWRLRDRNGMFPYLNGIFPIDRDASPH